MNERSTITTITEIEHPPFCGPVHCETYLEGGYVRGDHYEVRQSLHSQYGADVYVGLTTGTRPSGKISVTDRNHIALRISSLDDEENDRYTFEGSVHLEPEEALMLARWLTEAAERWQQERVAS